MKILLAGQKHFGAQVFNALLKIKNVEVSAIAAPVGGEKTDRLAAKADLHSIRLIPSGTLNASTMPENIDLIIAAHSHDFIGEKTRLKAKYGGIGYHPSLLPIHRGRDAIRWALKMRERVTGGTVYKLSNKMDGGDIIEQRHVFIRPDDTEKTLWENSLQSIGVELIVKSVEKFLIYEYVIGMPQDESLSTFEPAINTQPAFRPDLVLIGHGYKLNE
jgi:methionyl-tRNA formyltransferase